MQEIKTWDISNNKLGTKYMVCDSRFDVYESFEECLKYENENSFDVYITFTEGGVVKEGKSRAMLSRSDYYEENTPLDEKYKCHRRVVFVDPVVSDKFGGVNGLEQLRVWNAKNNDFIYVSREGYVTDLIKPLLKKDN